MFNIHLFSLINMIEIPLHKVEIPPLGAHLIVEVSVNGIAMNFVLDTGASRSVIDLTYLKELNPTIGLEEESTLSAGVGASELQSHTAELSVFRIGNLSIENYEIAVMDLQHVKQSYEQIGEAPIYGVIGGDVLIDFKALIDYNNLVLKLYQD